MSDPDNEGHSGYRIDQISALADASLTRYRPNVVTLEIGTNDLNGNYQPSTATARLKSLVDQITAAVPDATVLVASWSCPPAARWSSTVPRTTRPSPDRERRAGHGQARRIRGHEQPDHGRPGRHPPSERLGLPEDGRRLPPRHPGRGQRRLADEPRPAAARVSSGIAGKCLDVNGANTADGTAVQIWSCSDSANQLWSAYTDGTLRSMGKCLDAAGGGTANGTKVHIWACHGGANQVWQPDNGGYCNPASGRCLDDPGFSTTDGTQLQLWDCNGGSNQKWTTLTAG